jgi:hypothetical protein
VALLVASAIGALALAVPAQSHNAGYASHVTIHTDEFQVDFRGRVTSDLHACETHRKVKLYTGEGVYTGFYDRTDAEGRYEINSGPTVAPTYYTRATRKVIDRPGHRHVCRAASSPTI